MSNPVVSSFDKKFMAAFNSGCAAIPEDQSKTIKDVLDKIHERVISDLEYYIAENIKENASYAIRDEAAAVAKSMLMNALAGDDKEIRNLFGFNEWYMKHAYIGDRLPTQWALIDALMKRRPDVFTDERIAQRDCELALVRAQLTRTETALNSYKEQFGALVL